MGGYSSNQEMWKSIHRNMNAGTQWEQNIAVYMGMKWCG